MEKNWNLVILALIVIPLLLILGWLLFNDNVEQPVDVDSLQNTDMRITRLEQSVDNLAKRLDSLTMDSEWPTEVERKPLEPTTTLATELDYQETRLEELEKSMALLKARIEYQTQEEVPEALSADVLRQMIRQLKGSDTAWRKQRREKRIALGEQFLRDFPNDPEAPAVLTDLISEYIYAGQYGTARERLERLGPQVNMDQVRQISTSANLHRQAGDFEAARRDYNLIAQMPDLTESRFADNLFWIAYSYFDEGRYEEAMNHFQAIIDRYGADPAPEFHSVVGGAKTHLEKAKKYLGK